MSRSQNMFCFNVPSVPICEKEGAFGCSHVTRSRQVRCAPAGKAVFRYRKWRGEEGALERNFARQGSLR